MSRRDVLLLKTSNNSIYNSKYFSNNSLNLSKKCLNKFYQRQRLLKDTQDVSSKQNLVEVIPCFRTQNCIDRIEYTRIREFLNIKTLREILKGHVLYPTYKVEETSQYFMYQFEDKEPIYISKKDGRLYSEINNEHAQFQAFWLIRLLAKYGYVEGYKRIQRKKSYSFQNNIMNYRRSGSNGRSERNTNK